MTKSILWTLGYSGFTPETFAAELHGAGIEVLIDVRRKPISRKKGFSKKGLAEFLEGRGIEYRHVPELGMPDDLLDERREGMEPGEYLAAYGKYLSACDATLEEIEPWVKRRRCCLMCLEKDPAVCHRSVIAEELRQRSNGRLKVVHLSQGDSEAD